MFREKTRLFCPGTSDLNGTRKGLTPCTMNSWEKYFLHLATILWESATKSPFSSFPILHLGWYPFLKSLMPVYKSLMFWILLLVSSSSILALRYAFFLSLKCLLTSRLTLFRISTLLRLGSCIHCKRTNI